MKLEAIKNNKIFDNKSILRKLAYWRFKDCKIVFTNGCFDIIHLGHIDYLSKASEMGDVLIVGLNSDTSVQRLKGESRPINNEIARASLLVSLQFIDAVIMFDDDTPLNLISLIKPNILVKGADYSPKEIIGYDIVTRNGGEVKTLEFLSNYSTSRLIEKLQEK